MSLTVGALITLLADHPDDHLVFIEGSGYPDHVEPALVCHVVIVAEPITRGHGAGRRLGSPTP